VMIVLQYGCVFLSGFLKSTKGVYSFTLQYWDQLWRIGSSTMLRSVEYALIVSIAGTVFAMLFAYYMDRRRILGRSLFDCLATLPYMLPGTCFGIGCEVIDKAAQERGPQCGKDHIAQHSEPSRAKVARRALLHFGQERERGGADLRGGRQLLEEHVGQHDEGCARQLERRVVERENVAR